MRRRSKVLAIAALAGSLMALACLAAPPATAHPLGNFTVNRYSGLVVAPGRIQVRYVLDMAEIPTFQAGPDIDANGDGTQSAGERQAWADREAATILRGVHLTVGGDPVTLALESAALSFRPGQAGLPTLRLGATLGAPLTATSGTLRYADGNFADRIGWKEITARSERGTAITDASVPAGSVSEVLTAYPTDLLASPLDVTRATVRFAPGNGAPAPIASAAATGDTVSGAPVASSGAFASLVTWRLTPLVLALSLLLAFGFGAVHALGPGHGKTITAAYLVGRGARVRDSAAVGGAVALMHTASVLALGLVLFVVARSFPAERVYPWLTLATGAVALGLGLALLVTRLRAHRRGEPLVHGHTHPWDHSHGVRAGGDGPVLAGTSTSRSELGPAGPEADTGDGATSGSLLLLERVEGGPTPPEPDVARSHRHGHAHPAHHHAPGEDHHHSHGESPHGHDELGHRPLSGRGLAALAVAGGILPSPTAFVVLTGAVTAHRVGYGLALVAAFSLGLAAALMGVGMLAIRARTTVSRRLDSRVAGWLPIVSAAVIVGFGMAFALQALRGLV
jgi:ABC-type nickel/cobalt efflux system permease component RcnA